MLGDTVNTAARIESLNRQLGTRILIGRPTLEAARARVAVKARDRVAVKGKAEPVEVFEVLGLADGDANQPDGVTPVEAKAWH